MRKEIFGVILVFVLIFTTVSLLSYHPSDPSVNHLQSTDSVKNLFGLAGAHLAGLLIALLGLGSLWLPVILLIVTAFVFRGASRGTIAMTVAGGVLLMVTTGALFSIPQSHYILFDRRFSSGGIIGIPLAKGVVGLISMTGAWVFLIALWIIAFILTTRVSLLVLFRWTVRLLGTGFSRAKAAWIIWKERQEKAKRREEQTGKLSQHREAKIKIVKKPPLAVKTAVPKKQEVFDFMKASGGFSLPPSTLLQSGDSDVKSMDRASLEMQSRLLEKKLADFDVSGKVVAVSPGPVVTMYEYEPAPGIKINKIVNLADDLALALRSGSGVRIVAPLPGKAAVGIEVPNEERETVRLRDIIESEAFDHSRSKLTLALGKDILGEPLVADLAKMPHLLIAGATGSGKSVGLNAMICSVLFKATPEEVKLILVDPKRIELSAYDGIPHLIVPVVTEAKKATRGLLWAVQEMERRYALMAEKRARNIYQYNKKITENASDEKKEAPPPGDAGAAEKEEVLPLILIVIDELADLMLVASRDVELALTRLAQMARAAGIHLLIATQRPSVDVLTGIIKANFPTRISFQVSSRTDSRTILDANGAESLLGNGDMLLLPPGTSKIQRIHGAYVSEDEIRNVIEFLKKQKAPVYQEEILAAVPEDEKEMGEDDYDEKYDEAVALVTETGQASISMIQRRLRVGYNRAARMIEIMEREGVVGPGDGSKPREVLVRSYTE